MALKRKRAEEGAPIVTEGGPPAWLTGQFPERARWESWRVCKLRIDGAMGSGTKRALLSGPGMYRVEAAAVGGYKVVSVQGSPPQNADMQVGSIILGVGSFPFFGLAGQALEAAFARLTDGSDVQLLDEKELEEAEEERDGVEAQELKGYVPKEELSSDDRLLVVPLGQGARSLAEDARSSLEGDLKELATESGVAVELSCVLAFDTVTLRGDPEKVTAARADLSEMLAFYHVPISPAVQL